MALKSLQEINRDFILENHTKKIRSASNPVIPQTTATVPYEFTQPGKKEKKKRSIIAIACDILFFLTFVSILFFFIASGMDSGAPKTIFGCSYFTVLSESMQDEIPKGSLILVRQKDDLMIGDSITYLRDKDTLVTHKIIDIYNNYQDSGIKGYLTQGVNNEEPDAKIVYETSVIGKVVLVLPVVGDALTFLGANAYIVIILFSVCLILSLTIRGRLLKLKSKTAMRQLDEANLFS